MSKKKKLERLYKKLGSLKAISKELGVHDTTVGKWFKKYKIPYDHWNRSKSRKDFLNENFFEAPNYINKLYWIGFLAADGNVSKSINNIRINLRKQDFAHLQKFLTDLKSSKQVKIYKGTNYAYACACVSSSKMKKDLVKYNILPQKTNNYKFPTILDNNTYINNYYLGYIDGDGCIRKTKNGQLSIDIRGTKLFLEKLRYDFWKHINLNIKYKHKKILLDNGTYRIFYGGNLNGAKIINWLYKDISDVSFRCLERKLNIARQFIG